MNYVQDWNRLIIPFWHFYVWERKLSTNCVDRQVQISFLNRYLEPLRNSFRKFRIHVGMKTGTCISFGYFNPRKYWLPQEIMEKQADLFVSLAVS